MPKYQHENFGDVQNHIFAKGVITAVDSDNDTADVTVEGYRDGSGTPLFYHCEPDSEERSNGSIEGAASAFAVDDEVIVMLEVRGSPVRIVGFVDGIKACISLVDITFTINGKAPTLPHSILVVDSTTDDPETEEEEVPRTASGSSTEEEPGMAKEIDITGFVFPIKIFLVGLVKYYRADAEGSVYFYGNEGDPDGGGHTKYGIGKANYDEENPPDPGDYDYFERATLVNRTLGATYNEYASEMDASFTVYTLQTSSMTIAADECACSITSTGPHLSTSEISYVSGLFPGSTSCSSVYGSYCSGDEDTGIVGYKDICREFGSISVSCAFIRSDEDGLGASFPGAEISVDLWRYWLSAIWYDNTPPPNDPPHGTVMCEEEGTYAEAYVYTWSMILIQDKYI